MWAVTGLELGLIVTGTTFAIADCGSDCNEAAGIAILTAPLLAALGTAGIAAATDAPPDAAFLIHHGIWTLAAGGTAAGTSWEIIWGEEDSLFRPGLLLAGATISAAGMSYLAFRRDRLLRDPNTTALTHTLTWGAPVVALAVLIVGSSPDMDEEDTTLLLATTMALLYGTGIVAAELIGKEGPDDRDDEGAPMTAPLAGFHASF